MAELQRVFNCLCRMASLKCFKEGTHMELPTTLSRIAGRQNTKKKK